MNVANNLSRLRGFFATFNVRKLVIHQVEADDEHGLLNVSLVLL